MPKKIYSVRDEDRYALVVDQIHEMDIFELMGLREDLFNAMCKHWLRPSAPSGARLANVEWDYSSLENRFSRTVSYVQIYPYGFTHIRERMTVMPNNRGYLYTIWFKGEPFYERQFTNKDAILYYLDAQDSGVGA